MSTLIAPTPPGNWAQARALAPPASTEQHGAITQPILGTLLTDNLVIYSKNRIAELRWKDHFHTMDPS